MGYKIFSDREEEFELRKASVAGARDYSKFLLKCGTRSMTERAELCRLWNWNTSEIKSEIFYEDYQLRRAQILFPHVKIEEKNVDEINVAEVDRAEAFFSKSTGLKLQERSITFEELGDYLTLLTKNLDENDVSLQLTKSTSFDDEPKS